MGDLRQPDRILYSGERTKVVRVPWPGSPTGTAIRKEAAGPGGAARLRREVAVLARLAGVEGVPQPLQPLRADDDALLFEDGGGASLAGAVPAGGFDPAWVVRFARRLAEVLARVHRSGVIHKDINPANVVLAADGETPALIDFDLASTFAEERPEFTHHSEITGTLAYLAPEQTGRFGRPVDHRADLYALGATLYELLTGRPPFGAGGDPLQLIHAHLAQRPEPPSVGHPAVPDLLSAIVLRLLEKEPDERYQSAEGLAHDLARLEAQLRDGGSPGFRLAERDFPQRLAAPSRLVGREREIAVLADAYHRSRQGRVRGLLVSGASGVGKTSLLDELRPMVTAQGGWFVTGKFDQYRQDLAADAVPQALRALGRLLLAEPEQRLAEHRERLLEVLGPDAGLITGLPEFGALLRVPAEPLDGDPSRTGPRLIRTTLNLLRTLASPDRPIVMIIDDLQWATGFPVAFLDAVLSADDVPGLLLVGAYRSGEVDAAHPLSAVTSRWERQGIAPPRLELENLPTGELAELLAEMLRLPVDEARPLAEAVGVRTGGNPYDTVELVNAVRLEGVLTVSDGGWQWDAAEIRRFVGAGDVMDLLSARVDRLPATTRGLLHVMACLGGELDVAELGEAAGVSPAQASDAVAAALEDGLLVPVTKDDGGPNAAVRFRHDRVQQATYANQREDARRALHLRLARRLAGDPRAMGVAAEQYLHVVDDLTDPAEIRRAANLFLTAAADLRLLNALLAERHLAAAEAALVGAGTEAGDPLLCEVRRARHAALYGLGRLEDADELYGVIMRRDAAAEEVVAVTGLQLSSLVNRDRHQEAVAIGLDLLGRLGMAVPGPEQLGAEIGQGLQELRRWAEGDPAQDLTRPMINDRRLLAACEIINRLMPAAFFTDPALLAWLTLRARRIWADHGPCEQLMGPLAHSGLLSVAALEDYRTGYDAVRRVLAVGEARGIEPTTSQVRFLFTVGSVTWFESLEDAVTEVRRAREGLLAGGDLHHAAYTFNVLAPLLLETAPDFDAYVTEVDTGLAFAARTGNASVTDVLTPHRQFGKVLLGRTQAPGGFDDADFDEAAYVGGLAGNGPAMAAYHISRAMAALLFRDVPRLARHSAQAMPLLPGIPGMHPVVQARLLRVLALGEQLRAGVPDAERAELTAELEACHAWLAARAADAPVNFGHVLSLMDAELAWATGDHWAAAEAFDTALRDLDGRSRPFHRALTAERAASFHLERGLERVGRGLLAEARRHYAAWGAVAKVRDLDRAYPFLRTEARGDTGGPVAGNASVGRTAGHSVGHSVVMSTESMDLLGVLRAAQALSSETNLDRLRSRVVEVLTMMTGATGVQVVLWNDESGDWYLPEATGLTSLAARGLLPISAFQYAERTLAPLCVEDATRDDRFARDPYLAGIGCCSLLVVPILSGGAPRAMLVLENRLTRGAFSADRLDAVMLIAGQLAVCLDNALAERFRSLVQRSSDLTLVCDAAGTISYASTASVELLGVEEAALAGRSVGDLVHADDRAALLAWLGDADRADVLSCRLAADIGSGAKRWVETTLTDLTADPAVGGLMLRLRDVTERRQLEDELRHAQKLESVGQLAAGIAHEINTPIQFIGDNIRFLTDAFGDIADVLQAAAPSQVATAKGGDADVDYLLEEIPQALRDTLEGATRVATIVRAMKAFGHPGGEDKAQADLNEAVRNTLVVATSEIRHVADVDLDLDPELPPVVCNLGEINQVLLNLVINAVHAMAAATADGGRGRLTVRTRRDGDAVLIQVADTGTGIPAEIADRVFDQFFTTKDVGVGTGQGLALAHTFVHEHHGGTITFESTPGAGTTFSVHLPTPP